MEETCSRFWEDGVDVLVPTPPAKHNSEWFKGLNVKYTTMILLGKKLEDNP